MKKFVSFCLALSVAAPASALEWLTLGTGAVGKGGADTASASGPITYASNPGAIGVGGDNTRGFILPVTLQLTLADQTPANNLKNAANACAPGGSTCTQSGVTNAVNGFAQMPSLRGTAGVGAAAEFSLPWVPGDHRVVFFVNGLAAAAQSPSADLAHASANQGPAFIGNNASSTITKGLVLVEPGLGYGHMIPGLKGVYVGGTLKLINAHVLYSNSPVISNDNGSMGAMNSGSGSTALSSSWGVGADAGILVKLNQIFNGAPMDPRVAVAARNLTSPSFSVPGQGNGKITEYPQARAGVALTPCNWKLVGCKVAADVDLTRNPTLVDGVHSQQVSAGAELDLLNQSNLNIPVRVGVSHDLADSNTQYSAGVGLNVLHFMIEAAVMASPNAVPGSSIPQGLTGALQLAFLTDDAKPVVAAEKSPAPDNKVPSPQEQAPAPPPTSNPSPAPAPVPAPLPAPPLVTRTVPVSPIQPTN